MTFLNRDWCWLFVLCMLVMCLCVAWSRSVSSARETSQLQEQMKVQALQIEELVAKAEDLELNATKMMGALLLEQSKNGDYEKADRRNQFADVFACRGYELLKLERFKEAAAAFEIAALNQPKSVVLVEKLIECYRLLGHDERVQQNKDRLTNLLAEFKDRPAISCEF